MPEDHPPGSTRGSLRHRRPKVHGKDEGGEASPHDVFPEVPASERRVEKPLRCSYGSNKFGTLHITRNYLCWAGMGGKSVVIHFGEIAAVERESSIFGSIEVKTRMESPAAALPACANETLYDWGPGVSKCSLCGANPCWNRGCKKCNARLCSDCFEEHKVSDFFLYQHLLCRKCLRRLPVAIDQRR
ncbi:hypothetical protein DIPPA_16530 [Diplonema papillatum]|nr:hypothetical protein DIPPA_16530 [Diplonema papillatum]